MKHTLKQNYIKGIDIVISMDASGSMLAKDFYPNRFEASKDLAKEFVKDRVNDRVGLVFLKEKPIPNVLLLLIERI